MDREQIRAIIANAVGNPTNGIVADAIDQIADALAMALAPRQETRVTTPAETR